MKKVVFLSGMLISTFANLAQTGQSSDNTHVQLHVNPKYKECSFQVDSALTQPAFKKFVQEAGFVVYFRPLTDARPMGVGRVEVSLLQWQSFINENTDAWNHTFVHPDSTHWLIDGPKLPFPGLTIRAGLTKKADVGVYWTMRPGANYGFLGGQIQYNFLNNEENNWDAAARINFMRLYGPADIRFYVAGIDVVASKKIKLYKEWLSVSPYTYASAVLAHGKEKSSRVNLNNEDQIGFQISGGSEMRVSVIKIAAEYNFAAINSLSFKVGACFNLKPKKERPVLLKE